MPEKTVRLDGFLIQPVLKVDDGEELLPGPQTNQVLLPLSKMQEFVDGWPEQMEKIQQEWEAEQDAAAEEPTANVQELRKSRTKKKS